MALKEQKHQYDRHLQIAESATKAMKRKLKLNSKRNKNKLKALQEEKRQLELELSEKTEQVNEKNQEIAELMDKTKRQQLKQQQLRQEQNRPQNKDYDTVIQQIQEMDKREEDALLVIQKGW